MRTYDGFKAVTYYEDVVDDLGDAAHSMTYITPLTDNRFHMTTVSNIIKDQGSGATFNEEHLVAIRDLITEVLASIAKEEKEQG